MLFDLIASSASKEIPQGWNKILYVKTLLKETYNFHFAEKRRNSD